MRCGCPNCSAFMIHADQERSCCVCPDCGYRCNACLGTNTVVSKESLERLKKDPAMQEALLERIAQEEIDNEEEENGSKDLC